MHKRTLIVDDSAPTRGIMRRFLESQPDCEICGEAADGVEGIQKVRELKPDLIVLDYFMPRLDGLQAAVVLHEIVPKTPIILFTFFKGVIPSRIAKAAGVSLVLSKTDELATLVDEVQKLTKTVNQ